MERREFIKSTVLAGIALPYWGVIASGAGPRRPVFVYNNWSAYDELSDRVVQTEALAMRELGEILRLKKSGVRIDYYVMDAFWFDKLGGYRVWHKEHWPNGPEAWLRGCKENKLLPGMWFSTNLIATHEGRYLEPVPEWQNSVATDPSLLCLFEGGYLSHLAETLRLWYDKGVRLFKFDFAYFEAATAAAKSRYTPEEIKEKNKAAFIGMLRRFRERNPDVLITGYNGFGGDMENTFTPYRKTIDDRWLAVFDTLYCGDPRFSDVPMQNIWRSQDNYSDHQVGDWAFNGLPLRRIDNCAFMIGKTGTCYYRGTHAWRGMLLLELARGGWLNVYHGNLELLDEGDASWFARVQALYLELQQEDRMRLLYPGGTVAPYGFGADGKDGAVYTLVNPTQDVVGMSDPFSGGQGEARVLYSDGGYMPEIKMGEVMLGPEQLVVVGTGKYANERYDLGRDETIRVPVASQLVKTRFDVVARNVVRSETIDMRAFPNEDMRILVQQFGADGNPVRSWGGSPPDGKKMSELIRIRVMQGGRELPLVVAHDKVIWSGLSWGAAELRWGSYDAAQPVQIECSTAEKDELRLEPRIYVISYK